MANKFSLADNTELFKITYGPLSDNVYNSANVMLGRVQKSFDFTGKQKDHSVPLSFAGGVGSGKLPKANTAVNADPVLTAKKVYARALIERESIKASADDKGSFVRGLRWVVKKGVESWMRNMSRILFNDGSGVIGKAGGAGAITDDGGGDWTVVLDSETKEANVEEQDFWHYDTDVGDTTLLEVTEYDPDTFTVSLTELTPGASSLAAGASVLNFYMQNSRAVSGADQDPMGLKGAVRDFDGTTITDLYGVPYSRRWSPGVREDSTGAGITTDILNKDMLQIERRSGKVPKMIVASYTQYEKIINLLEDQKSYEVSPRAENLRGRISFRGVEFMSTMGPIPIFTERFVEKDALYYINDDEIELIHRPDFGWFDDDGTVFLRLQDEDDYEARYGGYLESYIKPSFQGCRFGLAV